MMNERLWWILACVAIPVGWISPHPAAAQQPMAAEVPMAGQPPMAAEVPVAGQAPLFTQAPLATQTQEPVCAPTKLGGQFFFSAGGSYFPGATSSTANKGHAGLGLGFGADLPIVKDPLFGNTWLGEIALNFGQFSESNGYYNSNFTFNELAIIGAPKYRIELGKLRPWIIPIGMEFLLYNGVDVGLPFGAGLDYMLIPAVSVGLDWRYNLDLTTSANSFMTYGAYVGFNFR